MDLRLISTPLTADQKIAVCPLDEVKAQARVTHADEDALIRGYIVAAYDFLSGPDGWLGHCCLLQETWETHLPSSLSWRHELPMRPFAGTALASFDRLLADGVTYEPVNTGHFHVAFNSGIASLVRATSAPYGYLGAPRHNAYRVRFVAGFTPVDEPLGVPEPIRLGMKMLAAHWYRQRETVGEPTPEVLYGLRNLCGRYRVSHDHS